LRQFQNRDVVPRADIQKHLVGIILFPAEGLLKTTRAVD
jgi:hypothetical protein